MDYAVEQPGVVELRTDPCVDIKLQTWWAELHHEKLQFRILCALGRVGQLGYTTITDVRAES